MAKSFIWNYHKEDYDPYILPDGATLLEDDMEKTVSCASCGEPYAYGSMYTSRMIHTAAGFGYMVCEACYGEEFLIERDMKERK